MSSPSPRLAVGPDCAGCHAPCCQYIQLSSTSPAESAANYARLRPLWQAAGADLVPVFRGVYRCTASEPGRCAVHETRPQICRDYSCKGEMGLWPLGGPSCPLPARNAA